MSAGLWYAVACYSIWGLFPLYWRLFPAVPVMEVLGHRILWSFFVLAALIGARPNGVRRLVSVPARVVVAYAVAGVLIGINWYLFVWGVNHQLTVEVSLGYFITPLVNVLLGVFVFRERLRPAQWLAVALAAAGVVHLTRSYGALPWIAVGLALSWGSYGLVKKKTPLSPLEGLTFETTILLIPAVGYLLMVHGAGQGAFLQGTRLDDLLLIGGGVITIWPLWLFAAAVQRIPLSVVGILQYIAPTIQFILGIFVFNEAFSAAQLVGFAVVWTGVVIFAVDGLFARRVIEPAVRSVRLQPDE